MGLREQDTAFSQNKPSTSVPVGTACACCAEPPDSLPDAHRLLEQQAVGLAGNNKSAHRCARSPLTLCVCDHRSVPACVIVPLGSATTLRSCIRVSHRWVRYDCELMPCAFRHCLLNERRRSIWNPSAFSPSRCVLHSTRCDTQTWCWRGTGYCLGGACVRYRRGSLLRRICVEQVAPYLTPHSRDTLWN